MFIDGQGHNPVFRDINSGPLGYPYVALVTIGRGWASNLPIAMAGTEPGLFVVWAGRVLAVGVVLGFGV